MEDDIQGVELKWLDQRGKDISQSLGLQVSQLGGVYLGQRLTVRALTNSPNTHQKMNVKEQTCPVTLQLTARDAKQGKLSFMVPIVSAMTTGKVQHIMAARTLIREWEESMGNRSDRSDKVGAIVSLGIQYQLASSQTSFVAVSKKTSRIILSSSHGLVREERERCNFGHRGGASVLRCRRAQPMMQMGMAIPMPGNACMNMKMKKKSGKVMAPLKTFLPTSPAVPSMAKCAAFDMLCNEEDEAFAEFRVSSLLQNHANSVGGGTEPQNAIIENTVMEPQFLKALPPNYSKNSVVEMADSLSLHSGGTSSEDELRSGDSDRDEAVEDRGADDLESVMEALVSLQHANGSWKMGPLLQKWIPASRDVDQSALLRALPKSVQATILVVHFLETNCTMWRDQLTLILSKAKAYLDIQIGSDTVLQAKKLLSCEGKVVV